MKVTLPDVKLTVRVLTQVMLMENLCVLGVGVKGVLRGLTLFYHLRVLELEGETKRPINDSNTRVWHETLTAPHSGERVLSGMF